MKNGNYNLGNIEANAASGLDAFFASEPRIVTPVETSDRPMGVVTPKVAAKAPMRTKVASLQQLDAFHRLSAETLVHKSTNDLWTLRKEGEDFYIERLFQDNGLPLKG